MTKAELCSLIVSSNLGYPVISKALVNLHVFPSNSSIFTIIANNSETPSLCKEGIEVLRDKMLDFSHLYN